MSQSVGDAPSHLSGQGLYNRNIHTVQERPCTNQNTDKMLCTVAAAFPDPNTAMFLANDQKPVTELSPVPTVVRYSSF